MLIRTETEFLAACLKLGLESEAGELRVRAGLDWQAWQGLVQAHGVLFQVYKNISGSRVGGIPDRVMEWLKTQYYAVLARNVRLSNELISLVDHFAGDKLPLLPFKGPALAVQAYGDYAYRSYADLDLLVQPADFSRFYEGMLRLGFAPIHALDVRQRARWARRGREFLFRKPDLFVDVHFRVQHGPRFRGSETDLFTRTQAVNLMGRTIHTLAPEYALLAICINAEHDDWNKLKFVADVAYLLAAHPGLDWDFLRAIAKRNHRLGTLKRGLRRACRLLPGLLQLKIPPAFRGTAISHSALRIPHPVSRISTSDKIWSLDTPWGKIKSLLYYLFIPKITDLKQLSTFPVPLGPAWLRPLFLGARIFKSLRKAFL